MELLQNKDRFKSELSNYLLQNYGVKVNISFTKKDLENLNCQVVVKPKSKIFLNSLRIKMLMITRNQITSPFEDVRTINISPVEIRANAHEWLKLMQ